MSCELCGRSSCSRMLHSFRDQDDFDNKRGKYAPPCEECAELRTQLDAARQQVEALERELKVWEEEPCPECGEHHECGAVARVKELERDLFTVQTDKRNDELLVAAAKHALSAQVGRLRGALEKCVEQMKKVRISINTEAGYLATHVDFVTAIQQAHTALAQGEPVGEDVVVEEERKHMIEGFHWSNHIFFKRLDDGSVRVQKYYLPDDIVNGNRVGFNWEKAGLQWEYVIPPESWASIVASVSKRGETGDTFQEALEQHMSSDPGGKNTTAI